MEGSSAWRRRAWGETYAQLSAADREAPLGAEDLERLATAAYLIAKEAESRQLWARAHQEFVARGEPVRAARAAFWLAHGFLEKGERAQASGWLSRARRLLDECGRDCVERGYLLLPEGLELVDAGNYEAAVATLGQAAAIGERFGDSDLAALARHAHGRAMIRLGRTAEGVRLLDEAMVAATAGDVSPVVVGDVYCSVISGCQEIFDWRRAREWTEALTRWCDGQPDLVLYRGQCLLRRAEVLQLRGEWSSALDEARRACDRLSEPPGQPGIGAAFYQVAELHRLRGELELSEEAFRRASLHGRAPHPGLALLWMVEGDVDQAFAALRRVLDEARERRTRARLLAALVEAGLSAHDLATAETASAELAAIASDLGAPVLHAVSAQAKGALLLTSNDPRAAIAALREAEGIWRELEAPYETARARALIGQACRELGDEYGAQLELEAAGATFRELGAAVDLAQTERLRHPAPPPATGSLTTREIQVLRLIASGKTNRAIAGELRISEKTVARHVSNIFVKLDVSSRSAATAYAFEHGLMPSRSANSRAP